MKKYQYLTDLMSVLGAVGSVILLTGQWLMAATTPLPDAGVIESGSSTGEGASVDGIATETKGRQHDNENYLKDVSKKIDKIYPENTPLLTILSHTEVRSVKSFETKYSAVGLRPLETTLTKAVTEMTSGSQVEIEVADTNMFSTDDTIIVQSMRGLHNSDGKEYEADDPRTPYLMLHVVGRSETTGNPIVYAVNGKLDAQKRPIYVPAIPNGTRLLRAGKACGELDVQTGRFNILPTSETQFCQNFMVQVEQSEFDQLAKKEVDINFSEMTQMAIADMKRGMETSYLFGSKALANPQQKSDMNVWFTGGIWYQPSLDIKVGHYDTAKGRTIISDEDLVDLADAAFSADNVASDRKVILAGSKILAELAKIKTEKYVLKGDQEFWNLRFKGFSTDFGTMYVRLYRLFDVLGMSDQALMIDPQYLSKVVYLPFAQNALDLKKAGVRRTQATTLNEVSAMILRVPNAHARLKLAPKQ